VVPNDGVGAVNPVLGSPPWVDRERGMALQQVSVAVEAAARTHLRRCTFRRLTVVRRGPLPVYAVDCLYPDRLVPMPLGDLTVARPICDACVAAHVFRPDED